MIVFLISICVQRYDKNLKSQNFFIKKSKIILFISDLLCLDFLADLLWQVEREGNKVGRK